MCSSDLVAPCAGDSCLYIADTGNGGGTQRNDVVIYRTREPGVSDTKSAPVEIYNAAYPADEDHEAEALFVADGQLYLVTKGHPSLVFRFPRRMESGTLVTLERAPAAQRVRLRVKGVEKILEQDQGKVRVLGAQFFESATHRRAWRHPLCKPRLPVQGDATPLQHL